MSQVRAFVGHSFNELDDSVVRAFLNFLDGVGTALPGFSWRHAERPEPKVVTEKVLELLSDRNVFIGICTRKERVVQEEKITRQLFRKGFLSIPESALQWKASDWVIQEIGLAIGRGLKVVLLLESGVRLPGELQGNLEHIPFDRASPERAFQKLLLMLTSLATEVDVATKVMPPQNDAEMVSDEPEKTVATSSAEDPDPSWSQKQYEFAILRATILKEDEELEKINGAYKASQLYSQDDNAVCWDAYKQYIDVRFGTNGKLEQLKLLSERHPDSPKIKNYISLILESYEEFSEAALWSRRAVEVSSNPASKLKYLRRIAKLEAQSGRTAEAEKVIAQMKLIEKPVGEYEEILLRAQLDLAEHSNDVEIEVAVMERILELTPTDQNTRFSLAYKYFDLGRNELSLLHYSRIPSQSRNGATWNNLGVAFDRLGMPVKSVDAYREGEVLGETIAMSNIANKQIAAGFIKEAAAICELAVQVHDHHKNVDASLSRLKEIPEEEAKKEDSIQQKAREFSMIYREVGRLSAETQTMVAADWRGPDCVLRATQVGGDVELRGEYQKKDLSLSGLMMGVGSNTDRSVRNYKVEYLGKLHGSAFVGTVVRREDSGGARTLLGSYEPVPSRVVILFEAGDEAKVYEFSSEDSFKEYSLAKL